MADLGNCKGMYSKPLFTEYMVNINKKIKLKKYKKRSVYSISTNKSIKDKTTFPLKKVTNNREKKCNSNNDSTIKN